MKTQGFSTNTGVGATPDIPQDRYPEIYVDSLRLRNGLKILQSIIDQYTGVLGEDPAYWSQLKNPAVWHKLQNQTRTYAKASVSISAGQLVNFYNSGGELEVRLADALTLGNHTHAYCTADVTAGSFGEFICQGTCFIIGGLTPGVTYYTSNTSGALSATPGTKVQRVGYALTASTLVFRPDLI